MQKHKELPFLIEPSAISQWLGKLSLNKPVQTAFEIYNVLIILVKQPILYEKHLAIILPILTPTTIQLSLYLERLLCVTDTNLSVKKRKVARLNINLLRYTAILYYRLGKTDDKQLNLCLVNCLQISFLGLKQSALIYEQPSSTLWKIIGKIYQRASEKNILDTPVHESVSILKHQTCITGIIKALLLFKLCKPYCLKQSDILRLSDLVEQHNDQLILTKQPSRFSLHIWDYNLPQSVQVITPNTVIQDSTLFLDSHLLTFTLKNENFCSIANIITCNQSLVPVLALTQAPPLTKKISTNFTSVIKIIEQHKLINKVNKSTNDNQDLPLFSDENNTDEAPPEDLSQRVATALLIKDAIVKENSELNFLLIELKSFSGNSEDLITIFDSEQNTQIGIIRKITLFNNRFQLLVETLSSNVKVVALTTRTFQRKALLYTRSNQTSYLIAPPHKCITGSTIHIDNQPFYLSRLLESTENFILHIVKAH